MIRNRWELKVSSLWTLAVRMLNRSSVATLAIIGTVALVTVGVPEGQSQDVCFTRRISLQTYVAEKSWISVSETGRKLLEGCNGALSSDEKASTNYFVALAEFNSTRYDKTVKYSQQCVELRPDSAKCWMVSANAYRKLNNLQKAREGYEMVLRLLKDSHDDVSGFMASDAQTAWYEIQRKSKATKK